MQLKQQISDYNDNDLLQAVASYVFHLKLLYALRLWLTQLLYVNVSQSILLCPHQVECTTMKQQTTCAHNTPRREMLLWPEVCYFNCMNEQLKCMLLKNFLWSLQQSTSSRLYNHHALHDLPYCRVNNDTAYKTLKCRLTSMQLVNTSLTLNVLYVIHAPEFWHDIQTLLLLYMWERNSGVVGYRLIRSWINNFWWQTHRK